MPITQYKDNARDLTVFKATGTLRFEEAMPVIKSFYEGEPTQHVLWDLTGISDILLTSKEVESIVAYLPRYDGKRPGGKTAFVVQEDLVYGMSRMFQIQNELRNSPYQVEIFHTIEEATKWLDEIWTE